MQMLDCRIAGWCSELGLAALLPGPSLANFSSLGRSRESIADTGLFLYFSPGRGKGALGSRHSRSNRVRMQANTTGMLRSLSLLVFRMNL